MFTEKRTDYPKVRTMILSKMFLVKYTAKGFKKVYILEKTQIVINTQNCGKKRFILKFYAF